MCQHSFIFDEGGRTCCLCGTMTGEREYVTRFDAKCAPLYIYSRSTRFEGVLHEFSSIPGVLEDITDVVLNVKGMALRMHSEGPKRMTLTAMGPGVVTASQIETGPDIEIMDPDQIIMTLK